MVDVADAGRRGRVRWSALGIAVTALLAGVAAWALPVPAPAPGPRPVTVEEAARMSLARFTTYQAGPLRVRIEVPEAGRTLTVDGVVDYRARHAVGGYRAGSGTGLLAWDHAGLGVAPGQPQDPLRAAASMPPGSWSPRAYTGAPLDSALQLALQLGRDRPDNAQLLAEQGPQWLRSERIDGHEYDVFSGPRPRSAADDGPSPLTYWIDGDGRLRRVTVREAGIPEPVTVDFPGGSADPVPSTPWDR
ncbi:hypothetical protein Kpho02_50440 [Kitasatospora phosalacinea]|uniref:Uncharacterized protein n=1 Tax=Kitasatospora phosalacinea TaxID=2065 RepID=A0A9W6QA87_9ACTN|nr:hypothetical protein [Kitasatospora phosalacinea]GLW72745.1 hypothetical protein Kpho02_50440 [Kitasatospora phosalacinea]